MPLPVLLVGGALAALTALGCKRALNAGDANNSHQDAGKQKGRKIGDIFIDHKMHGKNWWCTSHKKYLGDDEIEKGLGEDKKKTFCKTHNNVEVIYNFEDVVHIVSNKDEKPEFWRTKEIKQNYRHYEDGTDATYAADFPLAFTEFSGPYEWYGPAHQFTVISVGWWRDWGSYIEIKIIKDEKKHHILSFGHFTEINQKILLAYNDKSSKPLPAGTYLGATRRPIGLSTGAHLHVIANKPKTPRTTWIEWLK